MKLKDITHILIVDDDRRIRDLLGKFMRDNGFFVSLASDAFVARDLLKEHVFDMLIVDVMMPGETGVEFTEKLRKESDVPVLMLTAMGESDDRISGLESGADDYLPKPFEPRELLLRVQGILKRTKRPQADEKLKFGDIIYDIERSSLTENDENIPITSNEAMLLNVLGAKSGEIVTREDLAKLSGGINERSIDVQITRLRNKIEQDPKNPIYLKTVRGKGYVLYSD